jgi:hypothetical protein
MAGTFCATPSGIRPGEEAQETINKAVKTQKMLFSPIRLCCRNVISVIVPKGKSQSVMAIKLIQLFFPC